MFTFIEAYGGQGGTGTGSEYRGDGGNAHATREGAPYSDFTFDGFAAAGGGYGGNGQGGVDGLVTPPAQLYGLGLISVLSGGTGTSMTYGGAATFTFRAAASESLFLGFFLFGTSSQFESLWFSAFFNGIEVVNHTFGNALSASDFFGGQKAIGTGRDGSDSAFSMSYSFVANAPEQGFATFYTISNIPVAPTPVPAALLLLLSALAGLGALSRRGCRAA